VTTPELTTPETTHQLQDIPIGTGQTGTRIERDSMGEVAVPAEHYWGAQTQRSLHHFSIGNDRMPIELYRAYAIVKKAAAAVHGKAGNMPAWKAAAICRAADEAIDGKLDAEFPLFVWQTGSGTQSNMNLNEVLANRASQLLGARVGDRGAIHPNDDVNFGQSSNDTFPAAMHVAALLEVEHRLKPALSKLLDTLRRKAVEWADIVKIGRTHLQDAVPLTVGQEWSGYAVQLEDALKFLDFAVAPMRELAIGGTAVGTGLNAPPGFAVAVAAEIAQLTGLPFVTAPNKFTAQGSLDAMVGAMSGLKQVSVALMKIANDMRWLASGPRCGFGELILPENEPGSSIMPGKVNPTQCEAMVMICIQVIGEDNAVAFAGSQGNFELNAMRPIIINNFLHSARILGDGARLFEEHSVAGTELNRARIDEHLRNSLMLVTALNPVLGYDKAAHIAHDAMVHGTTLREAALATGWIDAATFDRVVDPKRMIG
jgi:fumarate hydratase class II